MENNFVRKSENFYIFRKKTRKSFGVSGKMTTFALAFEDNA